MIIRLLEEDDHRSSFESGEAEIDRFFRNHALTNHRAGISRVYVAVDEPSSRDVLGFYALSTTSVESSAVQDLASMSLPRYPMPALLIGQLAVDQRERGRGLGRALLKDALDNCLKIAKRVAVFGILVDALNEDVIGFYERFGFEKIPPEKTPQPMFLPMATLRKATDGG